MPFQRSKEFLSIQCSVLVYEVTLDAREPRVFFLTAVDRAYESLGLFLVNLLLVPFEVLFDPE